MTTEENKSKPHLVPADIFSKQNQHNVFGNLKIALLGYCPPPSVLQKYNPQPTSVQYFIHVSPDSVKLISHQGNQFLSLVHVYGGPVSASTVEELAYYHFDYILAYGLAGGFGTKNLRMNDFYLVESAVVADGTTPHYTQEPVVAADSFLQTKILELARDTELAGIQPVQAITGDAIYREDDKFIASAQRQGCDIVNLDSSHLFAVAKFNHEEKLIRTIECGVISDVVASDSGQKWDSKLSTAMAPVQDTGKPDPRERAGKIVEFYIERLAPLLLQG